MSEIHGDVVDSAFPRGFLGSWDLALPFEHVECPIAILCWFGDEAEGMIASPFLPFFFESVDDKFIHFFFIHSPAN